jgi:hypothetical protein
MNDSTRSDVPAAVHQWMIESHLDDGQLTMLAQLPPLTRLQLVSNMPQSNEAPDEVLWFWHQQLASDRLSVVQAERAFIVQARRSGWSWDRIAPVIGLSDGPAAESRLIELAELLVRMHPSSNARPWQR